MMLTPLARRRRSWRVDMPRLRVLEGVRRTCHTVGGAGLHRHVCALTGSVMPCGLVVRGQARHGAALCSPRGAGCGGVCIWNASAAHDVAADAAAGSSGVSGARPVRCLPQPRRGSLSAAAEGQLCCDLCGAQLSIGGGRDPQPEAARPSRSPSSQRAPSRRPSPSCAPSSHRPSPPA